MNLSLVDPFLVAVLMLNFVLLGTGRLPTIISTVAVQGGILGVVYPFTHHDPEAVAGTISLRLLAFAAAMVAVKGWIMPRMMMYALRQSGMRDQIEPYLGVTASLLLGAIGTGLLMGFSSQLPLREEHASHLLVAASLATVFTGFLLLTARREPLTQVAGYLVLENGLFIFGLLLVHAMPVLVEVGVLLDVFVGVFVMGIIIHHVGRQLPTPTTDHLQTLKD
jgi:hydrogenase-4 component E